MRNTIATPVGGLSIEEMGQCECGRLATLAWALLCCAAVVVLVASTRTERPRNLLIISIDTLRADHLGCYGYSRPTSPGIDALAGRGVVFDDASSTSPWTKPSHASLLTGLYPSRHGAVAGDRPIADDVSHLASWLSERGFQTGAVVNSLWLKIHGLEKGFTHFELVQETQDRGERSGVNTAVESLIERIDPKKPFFLFVHYYDVHSDYRSRPEFASLFLRPYEGHAPGTTEQLVAYRRGDETPTKADSQHLVDLYDASIRQVDAQLSDLLDRLRQSGLLDETLIVFVSDHGEEFLDHGGVYHGHQQYQELIRIPFLIAGPGIPAGVRVQAAVSLVDIVPTALALLDVPAPAPDALDGIDIRRTWQEPAIPQPPRLLFSESDILVVRSRGKRQGHPAGSAGRQFSLGPRRMVRSGRFKLHYNIETEAVALFDLQEDPRELIDVREQRPKLADALLRTLKRFLETSNQATPVQSISAPDLEILKSLGYVG